MKAVGVPFIIVNLIITVLAAIGLTSYKTNGVAVIGSEAVVAGLKTTFAVISICVAAATLPMQKENSASGVIRNNEYRMHGVDGAPRAGHRAVQP